MRNYQTLPYSAGGSDIDIMVAPRDSSRLIPLVLGAIQRSNGRPVGISETFGFTKIFVVGGSGSDSDLSWWGVCLDFNLGLFFKGQAIIDSGVEWPTFLHNKIPVLADGLSGVLGVIKEAVNNEIVPKIYLDNARKAVGSSWRGVSSLLDPIGADALNILKKLILADLGSDSEREMCQKFRSSFMRYRFKASAVSAVLGRLSYECNKIVRYLYPSGKVLVILGVDGAGKSTIIESILPVLRAATHNAVFVRHLRPGVLPPLAKLRRGGGAASAVTNPHDSEPSGMIGSVLRLSYLTVDYILGYWIWTRPKIAKQPAIVIFDRYAYDMGFDPRRFRIGLSPKVTRIIAKFAPKPDMIICLHGVPATLSARKGELTEAETCRQVEALKIFAESENRAFLVSSDTSIEETRNIVLKLFLSHLGRAES